MKKKKDKLAYIRRLGNSSENPRLKKRKAKNDYKRYQKAVDIAWRHWMNGRHDWATKHAIMHARNEEEVLDQLASEAQKHNLGY